MQAGKWQVRFGLHAGRGEHGHASLARLSRGLSEQTRLADARLAAEHERLAPRRDLVQQRRQEPLFVCATEQRRDLVACRSEHKRLIVAVQASALTWHRMIERCGSRTVDSLIWDRQPLPLPSFAVVTLNSR